MKQNGIIYKTTDLDNGLIYIGQTRKRLDREYYIHDYGMRSKYYGSGKKIVERIREKGTRGLRREILEYCDTPEELNEREKKWISYYGAQLPWVGYNISGGGDFKWNPVVEEDPNKIISDETREKRRIKMTGKKLGPLSTEAKEKMRIAAIKRWEDPNERKKLSDQRKGRKLSEEHKKAISKNGKAVWGYESEREKYIRENVLKWEKRNKWNCIKWIPLILTAGLLTYLIIKAV